MSSSRTYTRFTPKKLVITDVGKKQLRLYPKRAIGENWPDVETNLALNVNKTTLLTSDVSKTLVIDTLADHFGATTQVQIHLQTFLAIAHSQTQDPSNLTVISYHANDGTEVSDAVVSGSLKSIATRPDGLCFAKIRCNFDFKSVTNKKVTTTPTALNYFIPLAQGTNSSRTGGLTETFLGVINWFDLIKSATDPISALRTHISSNILPGVSAQSGPFILTAPSFDSAYAQVDQPGFASKLKSNTYDAAFLSLLQEIAEVACHDLATDPFQLFQSISQVTPNPEDSTKTDKIDVVTYNDLYNSLLPSLPVDVPEWSVDVHRYYVENLALDIKSKMEMNGYKDHKITVSRSPFSQIQMIGKARAEAAKAERELNQQISLIHSQMNGGHGFMTVPQGSGTSILSSAAERALQQAKDPKRRNTCWGCGGDHSWYDRVIKKVVCPRANNPDCIAKAKARHDEFIKTNKRKLEKRKADRALLQFTRAQMGDDDDTTSFMQHIQAFNRRSRGSNKRPNMGGKAIHDFFMSNYVLNLSASANILPIKIERELPHIMLPLGTEDADFHPNIVGILDTGASLTAGYMGYILGICENYPSLVHSIIWANKDTGYDPITLSGVVADENMTSADKEKFSINLPAIVRFHMPCQTKVEGNSTTFSVAIGKHVAVNLLIGMSFIRGTGMLIDCDDDIAEAKKMKAEPFNLIYRTPQRGEPKLVARDDDDNPALTYAAMLKKIADTKRMFITPDSVAKIDDVGDDSATVVASNISPPGASPFG